jgi:outer membrane protein
MTILSRGALVAALVSLAAAVAPLSAQKVGYVDSRKILQEMPARAAAEARMRNGLEALSARQKKMVDSLNFLMASFERDSASLSQADKVTRFTAMQTYDAQYRDTLQVLEEEAQASQAEAMQPLFDQIKIALDDVRQADGYAMIFDIGGQSNPIVSMDRNLDLSDRVLARIRAMPATGAAAPAPAPARPAATPAAPAARPTGPVSQPSGARRP